MSKKYKLQRQISKRYENDRRTGENFNEGYRI